MDMQKTNFNYPYLFSPLGLGPLKLKNRIAVAPMTRTSATEDGRVTDHMVRYYSEFAHGGFGLVITEGTYTDEAYSQGYPNQPGIANGPQAATWKPVTEAVHKEDSHILIQLMHAGALSQVNRFRNETIAPSPIRPRGEQMSLYGGGGEYRVPREMGSKEIEEVIEGFALAAFRARSAGFDGAELHGANGYLLDQFLTDYTNRRSDKYGGSTQHRIRFAAETIQAVRRAVGPNFVVGIRISQSKVNDPAHRWAGGESDAAVIFKSLVDAGADFIHVAARDASESAFVTGPSLAALAKKHGGVPVIANGKLEDPRRAETIIEAGDADVVSLARGALANMDWPMRVSHGRSLEPFSYAILQPRPTLQNAEEWRKSRGH